MTALDTNVIVRYLVNGVAEQAEAARALLNGLTPDNPGFIFPGTFGLRRKFFE